MAFLKNIKSSDASDLELVEVYRQSGDLSVLATVYQRYMELLYGVCLKYLQEPDDAKDAVMAVFEELALKLPKHQVENFKGWLYTLTKNHCLMRLRSAKKTKTTGFDTELMQTSDDWHLNIALEKEEQLSKLSGCLETLSPDQKKTVELFYLQNKCYKEIEALTGLEWNKVRSHIQNGRRNLKLCMEQSQTKTMPAVK